jgi:hypothetical protein
VCVMNKKPRMPASAAGSAVMMMKSDNLASHKGCVSPSNSDPGRGPRTRKELQLQSGTDIARRMGGWNYLHECRECFHQLTSAGRTPRTRPCKGVQGATNMGGSL